MSLYLPDPIICPIVFWAPVGLPPGAWRSGRLPVIRGLFFTRYVRHFAGFSHDS